MSDDDLIRRGDALVAIHGVADFNRDVVDAIRSLPAASPSPAERLALDVCRDLVGLLRGEPFPTADVRWQMLQRRAEEACRAAPPAAEPAPRTTTTGAIVSALSQAGLARFAEPASLQKPPGSCDEAPVRGNNPEPAPCADPNCLDGYVPSQPDGEPEPCPSCRPGGAT